MRSVVGVNNSVPIRIIYTYTVDACCAVVRSVVLATGVTFRPTKVTAPSGHDSGKGAEEEGGAAVDGGAARP